MERRSLLIGFHRPLRSSFFASFFSFPSPFESRSHVDIGTPVIGGGSRNRKVLATRHRHRCFSRLDDSGHSRGYTRTLRTTRPCCLSPATHNCYNVRLFPKSTTNAARAAGQTDDTNISPHNIEAGCLKTGFGSVCCSTCL